MSNNEYQTKNDLKLIREMMGLSQQEFAKELGVSGVTLSRWETGETGISPDNLEKLYSFAFAEGMELNRIKEQFYKEESQLGRTLLFHGAKKSIEGPVRIDRARANNDFGQAFYMGESFRQAALFISNFPESSVYILSFDTKGLVHTEYRVGREWLLTVSAFRGRLKDRFSEETLARIMAPVMQADYVIAPIADNRMYQIIDAFAEGEITDEQCIHVLAATNLGMQYVACSRKAAGRVRILERCYLCKDEKKRFVTDRGGDLKTSESKVRAARIKYRGKGKYIDELI